MLEHEQIDPMFIETHRLSVCRWNSVYISSQRLNSVHITFSWTPLDPSNSRKRVASADGGPNPKKAPFSDPDYNLDLDGINRPKGTKEKVASKPTDKPSGSGLGQRQREQSESPASLILHDFYAPEVSALREIENEERQEEIERDRLIYDEEIQQRRNEEAVQRFEQRYIAHHAQAPYQSEMMEYEPSLPFQQQGNIADF